MPNFRGANYHANLTGSVSYIFATLKAAQHVKSILSMEHEVREKIEDVYKGLMDKSMLFNWNREDLIDILGYSSKIY